MTDDPIFSKEYQPANEAPTRIAVDSKEVELDEQMSRDAGQYGIGKPFRVTQRARIIDD